MPQFPEDFVIWVVLATLGALMLALLLALVRLFFRVDNSSQHLPIAGKNAGSAAADPRFPDRDPYTLDEFYEQYYSAHQFPRAVVLDVLTRFAAATRVPAAVLRPEDTLASLTAMPLDAAQSSVVRPDVSKSSYARLDGVHPDAEAFATLAVETASAIREAEERYHAQLFSGRLDSLDDFIRSTVLVHRLMSGK